MTTTKGYIGYDNPRYAEVCSRLDMDPSIHFVRLTTRGTIGFTLGKPDELRLLLRRCQETGLKPSRSLIETIRDRC
jgi:hypothetical protein